MKKSGFTLIELLAVIVILAIIAIISVPIITDLINKSRYGAFGVTKKNIERAAELYHAKNADDLVWEGNLSYVTIGTLKSKKFLSNNVVNTLDSTSINDNTKVLLYRKGRKVDYSLQLYDKEFFDWYQGQMVQASKREDITLPTTIGERVTIDLDVLMSKGLVDELRLPLEPENRCVGYVEIEKKADNYEYNAYVDCLQGASTFASHYVSYGGKYIDEFFDVKETNDGGYIAVGDSNSEVITKYGTGNNGKYDAIIVKFDHQGNVEWSRNFGGTNHDYFRAVAVANDGYVAVGFTTSNDIDLEGIYKGGSDDAILVKYDFNGNIVHKISYGSSGTNGNDVFHDIIKVSDGYIVVGSSCILVRDGDMTGVTAPGTRSAGTIIKYDNNFNMVWRSFFSGTYYETFTNVLKTSDNGYLVSGNSSSYDHDMTGLAYDNIYADADAIVIKYDSTGNLEYKNSFKGSKSDVFRNAIEVTDGYILVGESASINGDMTDLSKSDVELYDSIIIKYNKTLDNLIWKKSFGGSNNDYFRDIVKIDNNNYLVAGYSKSSDMDVNGINISTNGYSDAYLIKYDSTGNVLQKKVFGGINSDDFNSIIKTTDGIYVTAGSTYSSEGNLRNFNKGHRDAILVGYDNNLNLLKTFQEPVVLIDKLKELVKNYGTDISSNYQKLYSTNNPSVDLGGWCSSGTNYADNINYSFGSCLTPFNSDDIRLLTNGENTSNFKVVYEGEHEYLIDKNPDNNYNWHRIYLYFLTGGGANIEVSNMKLKFADGYVGSIKEAVQNGYVEPLVVVSSILLNTTTYFFPTSLDIINPGGTAGNANYPNIDIKIKPKKSRLSSVFFTMNRNIINNTDGFQVYELRNFDISTVPAE